MLNFYTFLISNLVEKSQANPKDIFFEILQIKIPICPSFL